MGNYYNNKNRQHMFHTVYNSFESKPHGRDYLGKHSSDNPYDKYKGSFRDESFDPDTKIVLGYSKTVEGAVWLEMQLQRVFRVAEDPQFANQAYQTSVGFSFSGEGENNPNFGKKWWVNINGETKFQVECPGSGWVEGREQSGEKNPMYGKTHSEEAIQKMREASLGENNPFFGKKHSEEAIQKLREAHSGENNPSFGRKHWINIEGERKFQTESPGPEWQNGIKWKEG